MGRFAVEFEIANDLDMAQVEAGTLDPNKARRTMIEGLVDSGAAELVLPESVVNQLKLPKLGKIKVTYADRRSAMRNRVERVYVNILGRHGTFNAIVEPKRKNALIGAIVLEAFDLLPDCKNQRLLPRDPRYVTTEIETLEG